jgi:hypothetical protein
MDATASPSEALLALCARPTPLEAQLERVRVLSRDARVWPGLVDRAETEGLAPLLRSHLAAAGVKPPGDVERALAGLWLRHKRFAALRQRVLAEVVSAFATAGVEVMLLKGSALWRSVYGDAVLRPMRDLDVLVRAQDAETAARVLEPLGFVTKEDDPEGHHHLAPRYVVRDGVTLGLELHTRLERDQLGGFDELRGAACEVVVGDAPALTPAPLALLQHVYRHGFCLPLHRAESFRLIWVADVIGLVETHADTLDWGALARQDRRLYGALPWFGCLTPWSPHVQARIGEAPAAGALLGGLSRVSGAALRQRLPSSLPPDIWLGIRYGVSDPLDKTWARARYVYEVMARG